MKGTKQLFEHAVHTLYRVPCCYRNTDECNEMDIKCLCTTTHTSEFALYQSTKAKEIYSIYTKTTANDFFSYKFIYRNCKLSR
jgi:hypothetical protein